jgi:hypothetical protein
VHSTSRPGATFQNTHLAPLTSCYMIHITAAYPALCRLPHCNLPHATKRQTKCRSTLRCAPLYAVLLQQGALQQLKTKHVQEQKKPVQYSISALVCGNKVSRVDCRVAISCAATAQSPANTHVSHKALNRPCGALRVDCLVMRLDQVGDLAIRPAPIAASCRIVHTQCVP